MGFINSATTVTIQATLTNFGRKELIENDNSIFTHFILGDSDANYNTSETLVTGRIPSNNGDLANGSDYNVIASKLYVTVSPITKKLVKPNSDIINKTIITLGEQTVTGDSLTYLQLDKTLTNTQNTNYFSSLSLPIRSVDVNTFTNLTSGNGGWSDTSFSGLGATKVLMGVIDNSKYGELIDGKSIKISLPVFTGFTSGGIGTGITTYDIYSTFPRTTIPKTTLDSSYSDNSSYPQTLFGNNLKVSYLVSDDIQKPNNDISKSWSTGYDSFKPFSLNNKELINVQSVTTTGINVDKIAGVFYLDKGIFAITDQTIVENVATNFSGDVETSITNNGLGLYYYTGASYNCIVDSINEDLSQDIICEASRGEFYNSQNKTLTISDDVRISEVAITDVVGNILAIGKPDKHIVKKKNDLVQISVRIAI
jgi:hypothetical protein